jgi:anaerobic selenocysteine-containing dehydrogenase
MTANIGKPGAGPFSLTGQPNAMGGREAAAALPSSPRLSFRQKSPTPGRSGTSLGFTCRSDFSVPGCQRLEYDYWFGDGRCQTSLDCRY